VNERNNTKSEMSHTLLLLQHLRCDTFRSLPDCKPRPVPQCTVIVPLWM